ncbi:hypothetical protein GDO81_013107 [Engystomops pustulosus]|uniref:Uncharacterized protein n=1 Tax=Engystomops pustulosus TaxID=76066 RepID=A0AAV7B1G2_ENGPU|nr:hypothetical protein GDO81_013107 [Engystomops pustulosus]
MKCEGSNPYESHYTLLGLLPSPSILSPYSCNIISIPRTLDFSLLYTMLSNHYDHFSRLLCTVLALSSHIFTISLRSF